VNGNPAEIPNDHVFILLDADATAEFLSSDASLHPAESVR
jgi:hypothetical protein